MLRLLRIVILTLAVASGSVAQTPPPVSAPSPSLSPAVTAASLQTEADAFYRKGHFDSAGQKYQQLIQEHPTLPEAYAGLTRVYLKQKNVDLAFATVSKGMQMADSVPVRVALGEVYFRQGKIGEAEHEWVKVINSGGFEARAFLGMAWVSDAISLHKRAKTMIDQAYTLDADDPDIRSYWAASLNRSGRIKHLQDELSHATDDQQTRAEQSQLDYLSARAKEKGNCRLVSNKTSAETDLMRLLDGPDRLRGYALPVVVNGEKSKLLLDTGSGGILVDRRVAEKAGLTELSKTRIGGIGDKGESGGYVAVAHSIKIGQLEFQDCAVEVLDKRSVLDDDGLIGGDVFDAFLVDLDFPKEKLRLTELPKRQEDVGRNIGLQADIDSDSSDEKPRETNPAAAANQPPASSGPHDRFIAAEMKSYTQVFRFGHMLLVPTRVGNAPEKLFLLDTGAFGNTISPEAAREVTKVHRDSDTFIKGLGGTVKDVYSADKAVIRFGHLRQPNEDMVTFDLSGISNNVGTEISGTLGFDTLRLLDIKIDYRDGLVDFSYKPNP